MTASAFVATLVAPIGAFLAAPQVKSFTDYIVSKGGQVGTVDLFIDRQSADIFFDHVDLLNQPLGNWTFDVFILPTAARSKKILIADMESTIIEQEMLDELAFEIGIGEKVAEITRRAMNGELDFTAALNERVSLLKGVPASLLDKVAARMSLMPGAQALLNSMKEAGAKAWLVSGGFTFFVKIVAEQLGFDRYFANELIIENGHMTGEVKQPILDKNSKMILLERACADYGLSLSDVLAIGDGANDVPMLQRCSEGGGLGVAFHAKPRVRELVTQQINHSDLTALIHAQGLFL